MDVLLGLSLAFLGGAVQGTFFFPMKFMKTQLRKPKPNIQRFLDAVTGKKVPDKAPMVEYLVDNAVMQPILEKTVLMINLRVAGSCRGS